LDSVDGEFIMHGVRKFERIIWLINKLFGEELEQHSLKVIIILCFDKKKRAVLFIKHGFPADTPTTQYQLI
jgi:hypothetical protein